MIQFKGHPFPKDLLLMAVRCKLAHPLSYLGIEELMAERGTALDHSMVQNGLFITRRC
jgi:putative transposase